MTIDISARITASSITLAVTQLLNNSIHLSELLEECKAAHILPIPKPHEHSDPGIFGPTSLLSMLSKLLEKDV